MFYVRPAAVVEDERLHYGPATTHTKDSPGAHRYSIAACRRGTHTGRPRPARTVILLQRAGAAHTQEDLAQHALLFRCGCQRGTYL